MINDGDPLAICRSSPTFKLLKAFATFAAAAARFTWASWPKPLRQRRETVLSLAFCVFSRGVEREQEKERERKRETENGKTGRRSPQVAYLNVSRGFGDPCPHPPPCPASCLDASPSFASLRLLRIAVSLLVLHCLHATFRRKANVIFIGFINSSVNFRTCCLSFVRFVVVLLLLFLIVTFAASLAWH